MPVKLCATDSIVARITLWMVFVCSEQVPQLWHHEAYRRAICRLCQIFWPKLFRSPNRLAVKQVSIHQMRGYCMVFLGDCRFWLWRWISEITGMNVEQAKFDTLKMGRIKWSSQTCLLLMYCFTSAPQALHVSFVPSNPKLYCVMLTARNWFICLFAIAFIGRMDSIARDTGDVIFRYLIR